MLQDVLKYLWDRRTTVFGYVQVALGFMAATQGMFSDGTMRWVMFVNGLLTALLGHYNNSQVKKAADSGNVQSGFARIGVIMMLLGIATMVLAACGTLPAAKSYDQRVAYSYATIAVINDTAAVLRNSGVIGVDDARQVQAKTRQALTTVDTASVLAPPLGDDQLANALALLKAAQDLMCADRPNEPNCQYLLQRTQL